jgi:hypothetical protein
MASLLPCNREREDVTLYLVTPDEPLILEKEDRPFWRNSIPSSVDGIIHDFRDSDPILIRKLKTRAGVISVDDHGPGREEATAAVDLLPYPGQDGTPDPGIFLYGYTFGRDLEKMQQGPAVEPESILVYPGVLAGNSRMKRLIQELGRLYPLKGSGSEEGTSRLVDKPMAELILSSGVVLTYFGITFYEALLCERPVVTVNPTSYHEELTGMLKEPGVFNAGLLDSAGEDQLISLVQDAMAESRGKPEPRKLCTGIRENRHRFLDRILSLL